MTLTIQFAVSRSAVLSLLCISFSALAIGPPPAAAAAAAPTAAGSSTPGQASATSGALDPTWLAYDAVQEVTQTLAKRICDDYKTKPATQIVILDASSVAALTTFRSFALQADLAGQYYLSRNPAAKQSMITLVQDLSMLGFDIRSSSVRRDAIKKGLADKAAADRAAVASAAASGVPNEVAAAGPPAGSPLNVTQTLWATFLPLVATASASESSQAVTIPDSALAIALLERFGALHGQCGATTLLYPSLGQAVGLQESDAITDSEVHTVVSDVMSLRKADLTIADDPFLTQFISTYSAINASTQMTGADLIVSGANLFRALSKDGSRAMLLTTLAAGGSQRSIKNLLTQVFTGDWISYSGGVVVGYAITGNRDGMALGASESRGIIRYRADFQRISAPSDNSTASPSKGDNLDAIGAQSTEARGHDEARGTLP